MNWARHGGDLEAQGKQATARAREIIVRLIDAVGVVWKRWTIDSIDRMVDMDKDSPLPGFPVVARRLPRALLGSD